MDTFENSLNSLELKEDIIPKTKKLTKPQLILMILISSILIIIGIILIILIIIPNSTEEKGKEETDEDENKISEIICSYRINDIMNEVQLISDEYENIGKSILNMEINGTKINFIKKYKFLERRVETVKYILNKNVNMSHMFKNVLSLNKVEMFTNKSTNIISMEGTFESCRNFFYRRF